MALYWTGPEQPFEFYPFSPQRDLREVDANHLVPDAGSPEVSAESIAEARVQQALERLAVTRATGLPVDDEGHLGLVLGNWISAAVNGVRGEKR